MGLPIVQFGGQRPVGAMFLVDLRSKHVTGAEAETGSYRIQVTQLATKAQRVGASDVSSALSATSDVSGLTVGTR